MNRLSLKNNQLKFKIKKQITDHFRGINGVYFKLKMKTVRAQHVTAWTLKHNDCDRFCPKFPGHWP